MLTCPICNIQFKKIDSQHLKKHGFTREQYLENYPDGPLGASKETREKNGVATAARGPRTAETKAKIAISLKGKPQEQTAARKAAVPIRVEAARKINTGASRPKSEQARINLSRALKQFYALNPREKFDKSSDRYQRQIEIIDELAKTRRAEGLLSFENKLETVKEWTTSIGEISKVGNSVRMQVVCKCGAEINRFIGTFKKHQYSQTICHTCFPPLNGSSKAEEEINEYLIGLGITIERHNRTILPNNLELDFYLPEKNIAIEYHGLYWHSAAMDYDPTKHRKKFELCRDLGIYLIQIFEDEWLLKCNIVKSRLRSILGSNEKLAARTCTVNIISSKEAVEFLNSHHLQGGSVKCKYNYGLFYENALVAVMTFSTLRMPMNKKKVDGAFELVRFAASLNVVGGFTKLLAAFKRDKLPSSIQSWADLRWVNPHKNVYTANGFVIKSESSVGYGYTDLLVRTHRFGHRKPKGEIMSELEWNEAQGFYSIYDAGTINYELAC